MTQFKQGQEVKIIRGPYKNRTAKFSRMMEGFVNMAYVKYYNQALEREESIPIAISQLEAV
jgi:transcription antitermination factor NusG